MDWCIIMSLSHHHLQAHRHLKKIAKTFDLDWHRLCEQFAEFQRQAIRCRRMVGDDNQAALLDLKESWVRITGIIYLSFTSTALTTGRRSLRRKEVDWSSLINELKATSFLLRFLLSHESLCVGAMIGIWNWGVGTLFGSESQAARSQTPSWLDSWGFGKDFCNVDGFDGWERTWFCTSHETFRSDRQRSRPWWLEDAGKTNFRGLFPQGWIFPSEAVNSGSIDLVGRLWASPCIGKEEENEF